MTGNLNALEIRRRLDRKLWGPPVPFGPDGWRFHHLREPAEILVSCADHGLGFDVVHASIARDRMPAYEDLVALHAAVWPDGYAYQMFVPPSSHVNIHEHALHLWGALDGRAWLPDFGALVGSI